MGAPKGKPHRKFTQAEKLAYISEFQDAHISQSKFAKEHGLNLSMFERWMKEYGEQGEAGLASHRDRCGNRYAALPYRAKHWTRWANCSFGWQSWRQM